MTKLNRKRLNFKDLFEYDDEEVLVLKRKMRIGEVDYSAGDKLNWDKAPEKFPKQPENYYFVYIAHKTGDVVTNWTSLK